MCAGGCQRLEGSADHEAVHSDSEGDTRRYAAVGGGEAVRQQELPEVRELQFRAQQQLVHHVRLGRRRAKSFQIPARGGEILQRQADHDAHQEPADHCDLLELQKPRQSGGQSAGCGPTAADAHQSSRSQLLRHQPDTEPRDLRINANQSKFIKPARYSCICNTSTSTKLPKPGECLTFESFEWFKL